MSPAADPDPLEVFRSGRLGPAIHPPAADHGRLLAAVADALNACERYGLIIDLERDGLISSRGYVLPVGDGRLGSRWAVRQRLPASGEFCLDGDESQ